MFTCQTLYREKRLVQLDNANMGKRLHFGGQPPASGDGAWAGSKPGKGSTFGGTGQPDGFGEAEIIEILNRLKTKREPSFPALSSIPSWEPVGAACFLLVSAVFLFYLPVLRNPFVNWDDMDCIAGNPHLRRLDIQNLSWMLTTYYSGNWLPLTWLSFAMDYLWGGLDPRAYHATNVVLHGLNTLLVFLVCRKILEQAVDGKKEDAGPKVPAYPAAFLAALLFGLHPIHVESVAWAAERKDVLYAFFYLAAMGLYLQGPSPLDWKKPKPWALLGLYSLALMSKPMAVTLPLVFLILDYWPLARPSTDGLKPLAEKAPFFALGLADGLAAIQSHGSAIVSTGGSAQVLWSFNAFRAPVFYLWKMAVPRHLVPLYPFPPGTNPAFQWESYAAALLVAGTAAVLYRFRKQIPYAAAAGLYYLATLAPVLGFLQIGSQAAADRYTYLPSLGVFLPFSAGVAFLLRRRRWALGFLTALLALALGLATMAQISLWRNSEILWESVVRAYPGWSSVAYTYLGVTYTREKKWPQAQAALRQALSIPPPLAVTHQAYGLLLLYLGRLDDAIGEFKEALALNPEFVLAYQNLWVVYEHLGRHGEALAQIKEAVRLEPQNADFTRDMGESNLALGRYGEAETAFQRALELDAHSAQSLVDLATLRLQQGRPGEARGLLKAASALNPQDPRTLREMEEDSQKAGPATR